MERQVKSKLRQLFGRKKAETLKKTLDIRNSIV